MEGDWWYDNIIEPGKLPLLLLFGAFVVTFVLTRVITRMIRAGVGPFKDNVSSSGLHIHHAVPGIILLIIGALMAVRGPESPWIEIAGVICGIGMSLILDEFALILHLEDVYWSDEGRISVELTGLTVACIGFIMLGTSPLGVDDLTVGELSIRITVITGLVINALLIVSCLLKGKYRAALISCFVPLVAWFCGIRLARPTSWWARKFYRGKRMARAVRRAQKFDAHWDSKARWMSDLIAGAPSEPDPAGDLRAEEHKELVEQQLIAAKEASAAKSSLPDASQRSISVPPTPS
ncbi:MAG: hypothetical protein ABWZ98_06260 [Nakamurella sp.]